MFAILFLPMKTLCCNRCGRQNVHSPPGFLQLRFFWKAPDVYTLSNFRSLLTEAWSCKKRRYEVALFPPPPFQLAVWMHLSLASCWLLTLHHLVQDSWVKIYLPVAGAWCQCKARGQYMSGYKEELIFLPPLLAQDSVCVLNGKKFLVWYYLANTLHGFI